MICLWECGNMGIKKLKYHCYKVLPLVYDNSLSYYEVLSKVVEKINEIIDMPIGITFADPIEWSITSQYPEHCVVVDYDGTAYISLQPVPVGVDINNENYWLVIFNYGEAIEYLRSQIAYNAGESDTTEIALNTNDLVFYNGTLYKVLVNMPAGTAFIVDTNITHYTVDEKINDIISNVQSEIDDANDNIDALRDSIAYNAGTQPYTGTDLNEGDLVFWNGELYAVTTDMPTGTAFIIGTNITRGTVDEKINYIIQNAIPNRIKYYDTMADMVADFKAEDIVCFVQNAQAYLGVDFGYVTNPDGAFYKYSAIEYSFETALDNGGWALLVTNPQKEIYNDPINTAVNACYVAMSYCGVTRATPFDIGGGQTATNVRYVSNNGPYFPETYYHNGLQCSQFVNCLLYNMPYEMSKLANESNSNEAGAGGVNVIRSDDGEPLHLAANELAHYAALKGYLKETEYIEDAEVGDVLFWTEEGSWDADWKGIPHCDMVIGKGNGFIQVVDAGLPPNATDFNRNVIYPGYTNDAVAFVGMRTYHRTRPFVTGTYKLFGYARFPLNFPARRVMSTHNLTKFTQSYTAGQAQAQLPLISNSDNKNAKFIIWQVVGHSATKESKAGIMLTANTDASNYNTGGVVFNTDDEVSTGGIIILPFAVDSDVNPVRVSFYYRTALSVQSDNETWYPSVMNLYT